MNVCQNDQAQSRKIPSPSNCPAVGFALPAPNLAKAAAFSVKAPLSLKTGADFQTPLSQCKCTLVWQMMTTVSGLLRYDLPSSYQDSLWPSQLPVKHGLLFLPKLRSISLSRTQRNPDFACVSTQLEMIGVRGWKASLWAELGGVLCRV